MIEVFCFGGEPILYDVVKFPCGEEGIRFQSGCEFASDIDVHFEFENQNEIVRLLLVCEAILGMGAKLRTLIMPYVPYGRQDRREIPGESHSLYVFAKLVNSLGFKAVRITDPHSDVTTALIDNCEVVGQWEVFLPTLKNLEKKGFYLVSPDGGALKKIYKLAMKTTPVGVIECSKIRNVATGEVTGTKVYAPLLADVPCVIVDDICDGGRTFVEIAKEFRKIGAEKIILMVTHGFFTKGLGVFDGLIDDVYTRKGKVK